MNLKPTMDTETIRKKTLYTAARLFLEKGYTEASTRLIAREAQVDVTAMNRTFGTKENILCELVLYVLEGQFATAEKMLAGTTADPALFYAAETALQLYMAESSEHTRDLYLAAYSMPRTADLIQHRITDVLQRLFSGRHPTWTEQDFYELEIATGGIVRAFMARPCDEQFTIQRKVNRFIETAFRIFQLPPEMVQQAQRFIAQFDYPAIAEETISSMLEYLRVRIE